MEHVFDPKGQWAEILGTIETSLTDLFNVEGKGRDLAITDVTVGSPHPFDDLEGQRKAKLRSESWDVPVFGSFEVRDKGGKVLSRSKSLPLFRIPQLTDRHSYILRGTEYQLSNQLRLKSGVYARVRQNGEYESFFNLARGGKFRMLLNPEDGKFRLKVGTASPALYPLLKVLGMSDVKIRQAMGDELYAINSNVKKAAEIKKLYKAMFHEQPPSHEEAEEAIRQRFANSKVSPETTAITLGQPFEKAEGPLFLSAVKKLLAVQRGEADPDRRESPVFKEIYGPADIFSERMTGVNRREIQYRIRRRLDPLPGRKLRVRPAEIVEPQRIQRIMDGQFTRSPLSHNPEQINPLEMLQGATAITMIGEGGIRDRQQITIPMRGVDPGQMGFLDPLTTPEGQDIGVTQHLTITAGKRGREMTTMVFNMKSGDFEEKTPVELREATVAFPGAVDPRKKLPKGYVAAYRDGKLVHVTPSKIDYMLASPQQMMDHASNLIPFVNSIAGARILMAARHQAQATALKDREIPLVSTAMGGVSFTEIIGKASGAAFAPSSGTVKSVTEKHIVLETRKGEVKVPLYRNFPLNRASYLHNEPSVVPGDKVKKGQLIAESNFTRGGQLALGRNMRVAYVPYRGDTYEDAITVSESAARKFTSVHMHREEVLKLPDRVVDRGKYLTYYPTRFRKDQLIHIQPGGLPKVGTTLQTGDALALVMRKQEATTVDQHLRRLSKSVIKPYKDEALVWKESFPGTVVEVATDGPEIIILIRTEEPLVVGDKLAGRHGNKGIVGKIVPDEEMLRTKDGRLIDVVLNPLGVPSRVNPSQILETVLAKAAEKKGGPILIENFAAKDNTAMVARVLKEVGLKDTESLVDPRSNITLSSVLVGVQYLMKLDHPIRKKFSARSIGPYVADAVPAKRSGESAQTIDPLTFFSLAAHGNVDANLKEMSGLKAEARPEMWRALKLGQPMPPPKPTEAYGHLLDIFRAVGVRMQRDGNIIRPMPMTEEEIVGTSRGEITSGKMFEAASMKPERGGLFDQVITGGSRGQGWAHVSLAEPIPNPLFEKAILSMAQITEGEYRSILVGDRCVERDGTVQKHEDGHSACLVGGLGIRRLLSKIDVGKELDETRGRVATAREDQLNKLNRRIRFLSNFKRLGIRPEKVMVTRYIPVLPPKLRPLYSDDKGTLVVSDLNKLYRDLIMANTELRGINEIPGLSDEHKVDLRRDLYDATKALFGFGASISNEDLVGLSSIVGGKSGPKSGFFQRRVLRRRQDLSGRSTIVPGPSLGVDEVGIPVDMAWKIFEPFVVKKLIASGMQPAVAEAAVKAKEAFARNRLDEVASERPVLLNRSPSLHRHSILAMKPVLVAGRAIQLNPLVTKGFNADFDGDTMSVHVPIRQKAVDEAWELLPSKNAFSASHSFMLGPRQEMQLGLFLLTREGEDLGNRFKSNVEALRAMDRGDVAMDEIISVDGARTTAGRLLVNQALPPAARSDSLVLDKGTTTQILSDIARFNPSVLPATVDALKTLGYEAAYRAGFSLSLDSLNAGKEIRDQVVRESRDRTSAVSPKDRLRAEAEVLGELVQTANKELLRRHPNNPFVQMASSGARGNMDQIRQILVAPMVLDGPDNTKIPYPVSQSYAEGLDPTSWWLASFSGRKGLIEKVKRQSEPGAINKSLIATTIIHKVTTRDCGTARGITVPVSDRDTVGRVLAVGAGPFKRNEVLTDDVIARLEREGVATVLIRSPLTCEAEKGVCSLCFGHDERGRLPSMGAPLGIISAQSLTEPASQAMLNTFRSYGAAGRAAVVSDSIDRLRQLLQFPKILAGKGALSRSLGKVDSVEANPAGGYFVNVAGDRHLVPPGQEPTVSKGQEVRPGQMLSTGLADPRDVLEVLGPTATRKHVADGLKEIYRGTGQRIPSKHFEMVSRAVVSTTRILRSDDDRFLEGDVAPLDAIMAINTRPPRSQVRTVPVAVARGMALLEDIEEVGGIGKILNERDVAMLQKLRRQAIRVNTKPIVHQPVLKGIDMHPMTRRDIFSVLAHRGLKKVFEEGVAQGWESDIKGSLLPAFVYGGN